MRPSDTGDGRRHAVGDLDHLGTGVVGMNTGNHFGRQGDVVAYVKKYEAHTENIC